MTCWAPNYSKKNICIVLIIFREELDFVFIVFALAGSRQKILFDSVLEGERNGEHQNICFAVCSRSRCCIHLLKHGHMQPPKKPSHNWDNFKTIFCEKRRYEVYCSVFICSLIFVLSSHKVCLFEFLPIIKLWWPVICVGNYGNQCPEAFPTALDYGRKCCSTHLKINSTGECDGSPISFTTSSLCCSPTLMVSCEFGICGDAHQGTKS